MTTLRSAFILSLSAALILAVVPVASAEIGIYGIGGHASVGGGRGPATDTNYRQGNTNMIKPASVGGGTVRIIGSIGGSSTDDASSTGGGHANLRGIGPTAKVGTAGNTSTKIGGTGAGAAVPGAIGG